MRLAMRPPLSLRWRAAAAVLLTVGFFCLRGGAQPRSIMDDSLFTRQVRLGLERLYDLDFAGAQAAFEPILRRYPDHPVRAFLPGLLAWWRVLLELDVRQDHDEAFFRLMDETVRLAELRLKQNPNDPDGLFYRGTALGLKARLLANRDRWLPSLWAGRRALGDLFRLLRLDSSNVDLRLGIGLYRYYAEAIPDRYPVTRPFVWLLPYPGNRQQGLRDLEWVARYGLYTRTEAAYFLTMIFIEYEQSPARALPYVRALRERYPNNALFHRLEAYVLFSSGDWEGATTSYRGIWARYGQGRFGYHVRMAQEARYQLAQIALRSGRLEEALEGFQETERLAAEREPDSPYRILARLHQGMTLDLMGRRQEALAQYRSVLRMPDQAGAHRRARRYLQQPYGSGA
jgi:tetratricopeptide (TPR) repeat protein